MKVAICGYPPLVSKMVNGLKNMGLECTHFITDLVSSHDKPKIKIPSGLQLTTFFEFRRLIEEEKLEGLIVAEINLSNQDSFYSDVVKICKLYDIPSVYLTNFQNAFVPFYCLDNEKILIQYLEVNLIDSCNLNCKACTHYSNLFNDDFYQLENFRRDIKQLSDSADILKLRLMGGEPFKLKNLDEYLKIARNFFPQTNIHVVTNGLLIPNVSQKILDSLRENQITVAISQYPPTLKILGTIIKILTENKVRYGAATEKVETFNAFLTLHGGHNPEKSRAVCANNSCRFLRNGKIYKCPIDALSFKFAESFGIKNFPAATGVDIFAKNFSALMAQLDGNIELCYWCNETARQINWTPENNPKLTDWLADPAEVEQ